MKIYVIGDGIEVGQPITIEAVKSCLDIQNIFEDSSSHCTYSLPANKLIFCKTLPNALTIARDKAEYSKRYFPVFQLKLDNFIGYKLATYYFQKDLMVKEIYRYNADKFLINESKIKQAIIEYGNCNFKRINFKALTPALIEFIPKYILFDESQIKNIKLGWQALRNSHRRVRSFKNKLAICGLTLLPFLLTDASSLFSIILTAMTSCSVLVGANYYLQKKLTNYEKQEIGELHDRIAVLNTQLEKNNILRKKFEVIYQDTPASIVNSFLRWQENKLVKRLYLTTQFERELKDLTLHEMSPETVFTNISKNKYR